MYSHIRKNLLIVILGEFNPVESRWRTFLSKKNPQDLNSGYFRTKPILNE